MTLTTTTEVRGSTADMFYGQLWVHVYVGTECVHSFVLASGPKADLEDCASGKCSLEELFKRWEAVAARKAK